MKLSKAQQQAINKAKASLKKNKTLLNQLEQNNKNRLNNLKNSSNHE